MAFLDIASRFIAEKRDEQKSTWSIQRTVWFIIAIAAILWVPVIAVCFKFL
jgi:hypothetical protein